MIHINRSKDKKFYVTVVSENGEILSTSETLNSKQNCWFNIAALADEFLLAMNRNILVTDNTLKKPTKFMFNVSTFDKTPARNQEYITVHRKSVFEK